MLAGDFLFAQASWGLANLENIEVSDCGYLLEVFVQMMIQACLLVEKRFNSCVCSLICCESGKTSLCVTGVLLCSR